jgi:hypothetical protein
MASRSLRTLARPPGSRTVERSRFLGNARRDAFDERGLSDVEVARTNSRQVGLSYFRPSSASMKSKNVWMSSR